MALPVLTPAQRAAALEKAAAARTRRAEVKTRLRSGQLRLSEAVALADQDEAVAKMRVVDLLVSLPRVGAATATSVMESAGIAASRRIRGLGERQREALVSRFG